MSQDRRNDYDVTNTVQVSDAVSVRSAVYELFSSTFPGASFDKIWLAFYDFERLFTGRYPGYRGCDTTYHDVQHTLDMTLALARLVAGYERSAEQHDRLGAHRAQMAISSRSIMSREAPTSCAVICPSTASRGTLPSAA
jgi:hypothetical protein